MSYQVIARKYRPQRFSDVVGQEHVTQTLSHAIEQNRIAHAYLFVGPRGTGKTTLARIFAKCLNCTGGPKVDFADDDPRCQEIAEGRSLDVLEIDGASNRGIEEVRELRETVKYAPASARFKIYIIDEVHMLTKEAFNALLKTLEEPPAHVKFMFATTEPEKVLATILSRCQRFDLRRIPTALIVQHLAQIARLEQVTIDEPALHAIARGAEGGMRDAQSALDQLISFCGNRIVEEDVLSMFGLAARGQIYALAGAILDGQAAPALQQVDELSKKGKDVGRLLGDLLGYFRNLLVYHISGGDLTLLDVSEGEVQTLQHHAKGVAADALTRIMDLLSEYEGRLRDAASKRILIEIAVLRAIQAKSAVSIDTVIEKLNALRADPESPAGHSGSGTSERAASSQAQTSETPSPRPTPPAARPAPAVAPAAEGLRPSTHLTAEPVKPAPGAANPPAGVSDLAQLWSRVVELASRASAFVRTYLLEAHPVSFTRNTLTIGMDPGSDHLALFDNPKNRALIESKLRELGYADAQVKFVAAAAPADWVPPSPPTAPTTLAASPAPPSAESSPAPASASPVAGSKKPAVSKEDFKNDPLIRQALEIFKGQVVEIAPVE